MNHRTNIFLAWMAALLLSSTGVSAHSVSGGGNEFIEGSGWFTRAGQKTFFALAATCKAAGYAGHFEFRDKAIGLYLQNARITSISAGGYDTRIVEGTAQIVGAARGDITDGSFLVTVSDSANSIQVELSNGLATTGSLQGGDIRIHQHPGDAGACSQSPPMDTTPPVVKLTAPTDGATIAGVVTLAATATDDDSGVAGVSFLVDGTVIGEDTTAPYSMDWSSGTIADGSHTLAAIARDVAGNSATSGSISITVDNGGSPPPDNTPPAVELTAPANGATVSGLVTLSATASDDDSGVDSVSFLVDGATIGNDTTAPFTLDWDSSTVADGSHNLTAIARDKAGNTATSGTITVTSANHGSGGGTTTRVEETDPAVSYTTNSWNSINDPSLSGGSVVESNQAGATSTVSFTGTGVTWIGYRCSCASGIVNVYVDGSFVATVDNTYSASPQAQAPIYSVQGLSKGSHTFKLEVTGNYNSQGETAYVVVDAFDITQ